MSEVPDRELTVFSAARRLPAGERAAYLDKACAGDAALRQRIEELLQASDEAGAFLESPAAVPPGETVRPAAMPAEKPGDRIGRYKLLQQIGEGGCGVVYMAEQEEPVRRRVALKVIKLGMDTKSVIARFEAERQALALMDHPNIAKVLDAGATETGRPFFVMELVRGIKITDYCDQNDLSTRERLDLFIQVCRAIQHAHQKGVIHRDIKPSNILVTVDDGVPLPKVIDFGIAKATEGKLTDQTVFTAFEQFIGTPAYMSPEQAELSARDVDTRSDIYSLGVLLYELLTGRTPFDAKKLLQAGLDEIRRTIRQDEPARPSTCLSTMAGADLTEISKHRKAEPPKLIHLVRGDLDWIVMKALEKDRARRYETANGLASDILRHIHCEPVVARPPSRLYEFQKTVRRHKFGFGATAALITVLAAGVLVSWSETMRARASEREARQNYNTARKALDDLLVVADQDLHDAPGMEPLRVKLWREAIDHYKLFLERPSADPAPRAELARLYVMSGFAAEYIGADHEKVAVPAYKSALAIQEQLVHEHPEDRKLQSNLGWTHLISAWYAPDGPVRRDSLAKAVVIFERLAEETPGDPLARADLAWALYNSSWPAGAQRRALSDRVLAIREQLVKEFPKSAEFRRDLANSLRQQGSLFQDDLPAALAKLSRSIDLDTALEEDLKQHVDAIWFPARPSDTELFRPSLLSTKRDVAAGCLSAARVYGQLGKWAEALVLADRAVGIYRRLVEQNLTVTGFTTELWAADEFCASAADQSEGAAGGQTRRVAAANFWVDLARESGEQALKGSGNSKTLGHSQWVIADMLRQKGQYQQAEHVLRDTVELFEKAAQEYPNEPYMRQEQAFSHRQHGDVLEQLGRVAEAESEYRAAIALYAELKADVPTNIFYRQEEGYTTWMLAEMLQRANLLDTAEAEYRRAIALHEQASAKFPNETVFTERLGTIKAHLADLLLADKKFAEAEQVCRDALAACTKSGTVGSEGFAAMVRLLRDVLKAENKPAEVEKMYQEVLGAQRSTLGNDSSAVAATLIGLANFLKSQDRPEEAAQDYRESMDIILKPPLNEHLFKLSSAVVSDLVEVGERQQISNICRMALNSTATNAGWFNNASWSLATTENPSNRNPALAVELAERAVQINPQGDWNTVGVAYYRAGDFKQALADLRKSEQRALGEDNSYDTFFLAMAEHQVGNADAARRYYAHAIQWMKEHDPKNPELLRFQAEAEHLLGSEISGEPEDQFPAPSAAK